MQRDKGLGSALTVSLAEARTKARESKSCLDSGGDPIDTPRDAKESRRIAASNAAAEKQRRITFGDCCQRYIESHAPAWRNEKHAQQWATTLKNYCASMLKTPVADVDRTLVVGVLQPIWTAKTETATRLRQRMEAVIDWATQSGYREGTNPARWKGTLDKLLPSPSKLKRQKLQHHAALPYAEIANFLQALEGRIGSCPLALQLLILTAARCGEVTGMQWSELDFENNVWTISALRMKAAKEHRVPLSERVTEIIRSLPKSGEYVFPGARQNPTIHPNALLKLTKDVNPNITAHGFRSTFRVWCAERTNYPREVAEAALAHVIKDQTEAAYMRSDLFEKRRQLMEDWAKFCAKGQA